MDRRATAVLLPIIAERDLVVFTVRSDDLPEHAGHVSFPGGKREPEDTSLLETALREACEELGIDPDAVTAVRSLPVHATRSTEFRVSPFVGRVPDEYPFTPDGEEVVEYFTAPVDVLIESYERDPGGIRYRYDGTVIWGVTARILTTYLRRDHGLNG